MKDDAVNESITHFIGLFSLTEEQSRLRLDYEEFKAKQANAEEKALLEASSQTRDAPLNLKGYDPELSYKPTPQLPNPPISPSQATPVAPQLPVPAAPLTPLQSAEVAPQAASVPAGSMNFTVPPPSSMAAVVVQKNALLDNDAVGVGAQAGQLAWVQSEAAMAALEALAESLSPFNLPSESLDGDWFEIIDGLVEETEALADAVEALHGAVTEIAETGESTTVVQLEGGTLQVTFASGEAAQGVHLDGVSVDEMPDWTDFLPDRLKEDEEEDEVVAGGTDTADDDAPTETAEATEATEAQAGPAQQSSQAGEGGASQASGSQTTTATGPDPEPAPEHDFSEDFEDGNPGIDAADLGHSIDTGGNTLVNETTVQSTWLDGKVFVVGGDYLRFDGISQTNVLVERDSAPEGVAAAPGGAGNAGAGASETHNFASIETISRKDYEAQKAKEAEEEAAAAAAEAEDPDPEDDALATQPAEGQTGGKDISVSAVSYAEDEPGEETDNPSTDLSGAEAGETPAEDEPAEEDNDSGPVFPTNWAVTTITGDLIQTNWSHQVNFVSDSDTISYGFSAATTTFSTGDNTALNTFNAWELGFQYDMIIVGGNMIDLTLIKQMNVLLDTDSFEAVIYDGGARGGETDVEDRSDAGGGPVPMVRPESPAPDPVTPAAPEAPLHQADDASSEHERETEGTCGPSAPVSPASASTSAAVAEPDTAGAATAEHKSEGTPQTSKAQDAKAEGSDEEAEIAEGGACEGPSSDETPAVSEGPTAATASKDADPALVKSASTATASGTETKKSDGAEETDPSDPAHSTSAKDMVPEETTSSKGTESDVSSGSKTSAVSKSSSDGGCNETARKTETTGASTPSAAKTAQETAAGTDATSAKTKEPTSEEGATKQTTSPSKETAPKTPETGAEKKATTEPKPETTAKSSEPSEGCDSSLVSAQDDDEAPDTVEAASEPCEDSAPAKASPKDASKTDASEGKALKTKDSSTSDAQAPSVSQARTTETSETTASSSTKGEAKTEPTAQACEPQAPTTATTQPADDMAQSDDCEPEAKTTTAAAKNQSEHAKTDAVEETQDQTASKSADGALGDSGKPAEQEGTAETGAEGIEVSLADNLLLNQAKISTVGEDLEAEMDAAYQDTLKSFQDNKQAISSEVMTKPEFADTATLRVLYIEKDFKTVNVVQQTNVLGDDDSVQLAIDEFAAGLREDMEVTMGSNALVNIASVRDSGIDSTVMAKGESYSDALLHQADFVMPEMPDLSNLAAQKALLATEAVAFLSDDMIAPMSAESLKAEMFGQVDIATPSADIMQSMLA